MNIKPILCNTDMVRALLDNRKTVTRRAVKPHYRAGEAGFRVVTNKHTGKYVRIEIFDEWEDETRWLDDPYRPGDILYVRETWQHGFGGTYLYKASAGHDLFMTADGELVSDIPWRPSIHMPREAARIFLRVTNVRVERLQEIDGRGVLAEGVDNGHSNPAMGKRWENMQLMAFSALWDSTIKPADWALYGWDANPWVWVIEFERCDPPKGG